MAACIGGTLLVAKYADPEVAVGYNICYGANNEKRMG
jgi:hypothetical protein